MTFAELTPGQLRRDPLPLRGRVAVVTGVSRRAGIGYAIARRLAAQGASLVLHHFAAHDRDQPWGADPGGIEAVIAGVTEALADPDASVWHAEADLSDPDAPARLIESAAATSRFLDILVCNHARSGGDGPLGTLTAAMLDGHWAANARSSILLAQAFAAARGAGPGGTGGGSPPCQGEVGGDSRPGGRIIFVTSGQDLGPMPGEVAYAASKGALASITLTLAEHLADRGITLNTVNPGPVDTGYAPPAVYEAVRRHFPQGRWGVPDDPARLIAWLVTDEAAWITGQVINSEGGFRRWD
jgi:3-oxoacyl-[acyl-carrier protein] reductase